MGNIFARLHGIDDIYNSRPNLDVRDLVEKNMEDKDSRYLMLIGRADVLTFILE